MNIKMGAGISLLVALAGPARSENLPNFSLTLDGGWSQSDFTRAYIQQLGSAQYYSQYFTPDAGHYGKAALSFGFAADWDAALAFSGQSFPTSLKGSFLGCCILSTWTSVEMKQVDLDIGLHRQFGATDVRFGGGVIGSDIRTDTHENVVGFGGGLNTGDTYDAQHFRGIGPKLSLDVSLRLPGTETERLIAGLDVASIWGDLTQDRSTPDGGGGQVVAAESARRQLLRAGVYLGLSVPVATGTIRGGVRHDFVQVSGDDPLESRVDGFLQQGVATTTLFFGYGMNF
jgi:hypothetical protein